MPEAISSAARTAAFTLTVSPAPLTTARTGRPGAGATGDASTDVAQHAGLRRSGHRCGDLRTLLRVILPMAKPGIAAVALLQLFYAWNDHFGPQIHASENPGARPLSHGLESSKGATTPTGTSPWPRPCWSWPP